MRTPTLLWPDGTLHRGRDWDELLEDLRSHPWNRDLTTEQLRHALAKRAWIWSFTRVDPLAPTSKFFQDLERAGLVRIIS